MKKTGGILGKPISRRSRAQGRRGDRRRDGRHRLPDGLGAEPQGRHAQPHRHVLFDDRRHRQARRAQDLGFKVEMSVVDHPGLLNRMVNDPNSIDIADMEIWQTKVAVPQGVTQAVEIAKIKNWAQADAALHGRHLRRQGSVAPGRLAVRVHVSRRRGRHDLRQPARPTSRPSCRASTTPTRWASVRTSSAARSPAGPTSSRPTSRARRRSRTSRPTASWTP